MALDPATRAWVLSRLPAGAGITGAEVLHGGSSAVVHRIVLDDGGRCVLRTISRPELAARASDMLCREAWMLRLLGPSEIPVPALLGVDPAGAACGHPSLLMTEVPGRVRVDDDGAGARARALGRQLAAIHRFRPPEPLRPPRFTPWAWPGEIPYPHGTDRRAMWRHAERLITREPPPYRGCFLHRDFHLGNVLFGPRADAIAGVIDWTDTSWGPADLDVGHCAAMLALLHGEETARSFVSAYRGAGGRLTERRDHHLYWRLLSALALAPDAANAGGPWRDLGRADRTQEVLRAALERHLEHLLDTFE